MKIIKDNAIVSFSIASSEALIIKAKNLCHDVYLEMGYIDQPYPGRIIPNNLEHASSYIVATSNDGNVIGTLRLISGPPFATLKAWENKLFPRFDLTFEEINSGKAFELGALAVWKEYSALKISHGLYRAAYNCAIAFGMDYGIISMDARAFRCLEMAGWKTIQIGEPMLYFGSVTIPAILPVALQQEPDKNQSIDSSLSLAV